MTQDNILSLIDKRINDNIEHTHYFNKMIIEYKRIENKTHEQRAKIVTFKEKIEGYRIANEQLNDIKLSITFYDNATTH